jgi:hypothetical protein
MEEKHDHAPVGWTKARPAGHASSLRRRHSAWPGQIMGRRRAHSKMEERPGGQPVEKPVDGQ